MEPDWPFSVFKFELVCRADLLAERAISPWAIMHPGLLCHISSAKSGHCILMRLLWHRISVECYLGENYRHPENKLRALEVLAQCRHPYISLNTGPYNIGLSARSALIAPLTERLRFLAHLHSLKPTAQLKQVLCIILADLSRSSPGLSSEFIYYSCWLRYMVASNLAGISFYGR